MTALWLRDNLDKVRVFDASYHLPNVDRDAQAEFDAGHIPGAGRFDIDHIRTTAPAIWHRQQSSFRMLYKPGKR